MKIELNVTRNMIKEVMAKYGAGNCKIGAIDLKTGEYKIEVNI